MHRQIEPAVAQLFLQLLGEQPLATDLGQRPVGHPVALGRQHHDLERDSGRSCAAISRERVS
jgi:hypothetical protein